MTMEAGAPASLQGIKPPLLLSLRLRSHQQTSTQITRSTTTNHSDSIAQSPTSALKTTIKMKAVMILTLLAAAATSTPLPISGDIAAAADAYGRLVKKDSK